MSLKTAIVTLLVMSAMVRAARAELSRNQYHGELAAGVGKPAGGFSPSSLGDFRSDEYQFKIQCGRKQENSSNINGNRIFNGATAREGQFPSFVAMAEHLDKGEYHGFCGGVLIDDDLVLTAAHCLAKPREFSVSQTIWAANIWNAKNVTVLKPARVCIGDLYGQIPRTRNGFAGNINDYALVRLATPLKSAQTACLPNREVTETDNVTLVGLGRMESSKHPDSLQYFVGRKETCAKEDLHRSTICLRADKYESDTCKGDSGGPIYAEQGLSNTVIALTSYGNSECDKDESPSIYANLFNLREDILKLAASCELTWGQQDSAASDLQRNNERPETETIGDEFLVPADQAVGNKSLFVSVLQQVEIIEFVRCRGVLIARDIVLTAGQCLKGDITGVTMGIEDTNSITESETYNHNGTYFGFGYGYFFNSTQILSTINDYGLIRLDRPVKTALLARIGKRRLVGDGTLTVFLKSNCSSVEPPEPYAVKRVPCDKSLKKLGPSIACFKLKKSHQKPDSCPEDLGSPIFSKISDISTSIVGLVTKFRIEADGSDITIVGSDLVSLRREVSRSWSEILSTTVL